MFPEAGLPNGALNVVFDSDNVSRKVWGLDPEDVLHGSIPVGKHLQNLQRIP